MSYYSKNFNDKEEAEVIENGIAGSSGSSCFLGDCLVKTYDGYRPISALRENDLIIGYTKEGLLEVCSITKVLIHGKEETSDLITFTTEEGKLPPVTDNHGIYDRVTKEHKQAKDFFVGDSLTDLLGASLVITKIEITEAASLPEDNLVYNLEVSPCHTFLVGSYDLWVRVHNGGGGKADTPRVAVEASNTLQAETIVQVLEVISEGEIAGIIGDWKGVYINQIPVIDSADKENFYGITGELRTGLPVQTSIPGYEETFNVYQLQIEIKIGFPTTRNLISTDIDAVVVTMRLPEGLSLQDKTNGDLNGHFVTYRIERRTLAGGTWETALEHTLQGKTISAYEIDHRIEKPVGNTGSIWAFRVTRISPDPVGAEERSKLVVARWSEVSSSGEPQTYPDIALVSLSVPARAVGNQIPSRGYLVKGIIVEIPTNYDPVLRTYTGTWDGSFKRAWTDNTAWILYALLTNSRYGVQSSLPTGTTLKVNKWEFYLASQYNDELVPDGFGGMEARYTFNTSIQKQSSSWQLLHAVASNMRARLLDYGNEISIIQDRPATSVKIFTNANVLGGDFNYTTSSTQERTTSVNVTFSDKHDRYLPRTVNEQYPEHIALYGYKEADYTAFGVVTEGAARRLAKWALLTEARQYENVTLQVALNIVDVQVGEVITVMDNDYVTDTNTIFLAGRILSIIGNTVTLDREITIESGFTMGFAPLDYEGSAIEIPVTNGAGVYSQVNLASTPPAGDYEYHEFYVYKVGTIEPRQFRVTSITETDLGKYTLSGVLYDRTKYDAVEFGIFAELPQYFYLEPLKNVTNLKVTADSLNDNNVITNLLRISWVAPVTSKNDGYVITIKKDDGDLMEFRKLETFLEFHNVTKGVYYITVYTDFFGRRSSGTTLTYNFATSAILAPVNLRTQEGITGTFSTSFLELLWDYNPINGEGSGISPLQDYLIEGWETTTNTLKVSAYIPFNKDPASLYGGRVIYTRDEIIRDFGTPVRSILVKAYARDTLGRVSAIPSLLNVTNIAPPVPLGTLTGFSTTMLVTLDPSVVVPDTVDLILVASNVSGFIPARDNIYGKAPASKAIGGVSFSAPIGTHYARFALTDNYNDEDLNWTPEYTVIVAEGETTIVFDTPPAPTNLNVSQVTNITSSGTVNVTTTLSWNAPVGRVSTYTVAYRDVTDNPSAPWIYFDMSTNSGVIPDAYENRNYIVKVRANLVDSFSPYTPELTFSTIGDTIGPGAPSNLQVTNSLDTITVSWTNPTDADGKHMEIWVREDINDRSGAAKVAHVAGTSYTFPNLGAGRTGYVWIRGMDTSGNYSVWFPDSPTAGVLAKTTDNYTGQINGISADDILNNLDTLVLDYNTNNNSNYNPIIAPVNPPFLTSSIIPNGTAEINLSWVWNGDEKDIDGFAVFAKMSTNSGTINITQVASDELVFQAPANRRYLSVPGSNATYYYTVGVAAYRKVTPHATLAPQGILLSSMIYASPRPYRPASVTTFDGDFVGVIPKIDLNKWDKVTDTGGKPDNFADQTSLNQAASIVNQGQLAVLNQISAAQTNLAGIDPSSGALAASSVTATQMTAGAATFIEAYIANLNAVNITGNGILDITGRAVFNGASDNGTSADGTITASAHANTTLTTNVGFAGHSNTIYGAGLLGSSTATNGGFGVYAQSYGSSGSAVQAVAYGNNGFGVFGKSTNGAGIFGETSTGVGVAARATGVGGVALQVLGTMEVSNTTKVDNLNVGYLNGKADTSYCQVMSTQSGTAAAGGGGFIFKMEGSLAGAYLTKGTGSTVSITDISDRSKKYDIEEEKLGLDFIRQQVPYSFKMKGQDGLIHHGFIAQDQSKFFDRPNEDVLYLQSDDGLFGTGLLARVSILTKAVQELDELVTKQNNLIKEVLNNGKNGNDS